MDTLTTQVSGDFHGDMLISSVDFSDVIDKECRIDYKRMIHVMTLNISEHKSMHL